MISSAWNTPYQVWVIKIFLAYYNNFCVPCMSQLYSFLYLFQMWISMEQWDHELLCQFDICKFHSVAYILIACLAAVWKLHNTEVTINLAYEALSSARRDEDDLCLSGWERWIRSAWRVIMANFLITSVPSVCVAFIKSHNCIGLTCSFIHFGFFSGFSSELACRPCLSRSIKVDWSLCARSVLNTASDGSTVIKSAYVYLCVCCV